MLADDAPAIDAPAFLAAGMSNAQLIGRPSLTLGGQPSAIVLALEIITRAEGAPAPEPPPVPGIVTSGLVMHLDAGNAASYPGSGTAWTDLSGAGNNGTLINGPTYSAANGGQIVFDGVNDEASISASSSLTFGSAGNFTFDVWFKLNSTSFNYGVIYNFRHNIDVTWDNYFLRFGDTGFGDKLQFGSTAISASTCFSFPETKSSCLNQWVSFCHVRGSNQSSAYINGAARNFNSGANPSAYPLSSYADSTGSSTAYSKRLGTDGGSFFPGSVAIARIYNRALSASEIAQNFNANKARFGL